MLSEEHISWLVGDRKIARHVAEQHVETTEVGRLAFRFLTADGELRYRKARIAKPDGGKSFVRDVKGAASLPFNLPAAAHGDRNKLLVITEGEIDCLSCITAGHAETISVPDGAQGFEVGSQATEFSGVKAFEWMWHNGKLRSELAGFRGYVLATDGDASGMALRDALAMRLGKMLCWWFAWPEGVKDANEVLQKLGADALRNLISAAKPMIPNSLATIDDFPPSQEIPTFRPWMQFENLRIASQTLMVVTGPPNSGKSQFTLSMQARLARQGWRVAYLGFEDTATRVHVDLLRYGHVVCGMVEADAREWVRDRFRFIHPEVQANGDLTFEWVWSALHEAAIRHGCRAIVLDPWNEIQHAFERGLTQAQYLNDALRQLKKWARALDVMVCVIAHPNAYAGTNNKTIDDWNMYALDGGAAWYNKADYGLIILRDDIAKCTHIKVAKSRDWERYGCPGVGDFRFLAAGADYEFVGMHGAPAAKSRARRSSDEDENRSRPLRGG